MPIDSDIDAVLDSNLDAAIDAQLDTALDSRLDALLPAPTTPTNETVIGQGVSLVEDDSEPTGAVEGIGEFGMGVVGELHKRGLGPSVTGVLSGLGIETSARPEDFPEATPAQKAVAEITRDLTDPATALLGMFKGVKAGGAALGAFGAASEVAGQANEFGEVVDLSKVAERAAIDGTIGLAIGKLGKLVTDKAAAVREADEVMLDVAGLAKQKIAEGINPSTAFSEASLELGVDSLKAAKAARSGAQQAARRVASDADTLKELNRVIDEDLVLLGSKGQRLARTVRESGMVQAPLRKMTETGFVKHADALLTPISTRIANISKPVATALRRHELAEHQLVGQSFQRVRPWVNAVKRLRKTAPAQAKALDVALMNANETGGFHAAEAIMARNGLPMEAWATVRAELEGIRPQLQALGQTRLGLDNFFPRHVKDIKALRESIDPESGGAIARALDEAAIAKRAAGNGTGELTVAESSRVVNSVLRKTTGTAVTGKSRTIDEVTADLAKHYDNVEDSLPDYLSNALRDISSRKFWGNGANGKRVDGELTPVLLEELQKLTPDTQGELETLLQSRLSGAATPTGSITQHFKNLSYLVTVANPLNTMVQFADLPLAAYKNGMGASMRAAFQAMQTGRASAIVDDVIAKYPDQAGSVLTAIQRGGDSELASAVARMPIPVEARSKLLTKLTGAQSTLQSNIDIADVGLIDNIAAEITKDRGSLAKATEFMFKTSGFAKLDRFGKRVHMNGSLNKLRKMDAQKMIDTYGSGYADIIPKAQADLAAGNTKSPEVISLVWHDLLDMQPITLSELPEVYLKHPSSRMIYTLKSFGLKQMDIMRRDALQEMAAGRVGNGVKNLMTLTAATTVGVGSYRAAKDMILAKDDVSTGDRVLDSMLGMVMLSKYTADQVGKGDLKGAIASQIIPPAVSLYGDAIKDVISIADQDAEFEFEVGKHLPVVKDIMARSKNDG